QYRYGGTDWVADLLPAPQLLSAFYFRAPLSREAVDFCQTQAGVLSHRVAQAGVLVRLLRRPARRRQIEMLHLPVVDRVTRLEHVDAADHVDDATEAELRHDLARFLRDHEQVVHDMLGLPRELLAEHRILRRDADRASVEVTLAHHD